MGLKNSSSTESTPNPPSKNYRVWQCMKFVWVGVYYNFCLCMVIFYGFDPMGFITILHHHLGNIFVIFSNHLSG